MAAPPRYDRSITTFDPSGRLLQVEYGLQAARRGSSYLVASALDDDKNESAIFIIIAGGRSASTQTTLSSAPSALTAVNDNISYNKVFRVDDHLWLVTSGLVGDARTLAAQMRIVCQRHRLSFGVAPRVEQAARQTASLQHQLTRTGGARPLGCTTMVLGVDSLSSSSLSSSATAARRHDPHGSVRIFRTDPGGIMEDCLYYAGGRDGDKLLTALATLYKADNTVKLDHPVMASKLTKIMAEATGQKKLSVDVWVIRPNHTCRGNMEAILFANVPCDKQDGHLFASLL